MWFSTKISMPPAGRRVAVITGAGGICGAYWEAHPSRQNHVVWVGDDGDRKDVEYWCSADVANELRDGV